MAYVVELSQRAERDLNGLFEYLNATDSAVARRWFNGPGKAIYSLERHPRRCPRAPETRKAGRLLRHLLYGKRPRVYRVLYRIDELSMSVQILAIRHGAQDEWTAKGTSNRSV